MLFTVQSQGKSLLFQDDPALSCKVAAIFPRVLLCSDVGLNWEKLQSIIRLISGLNCAYLMVCLFSNIILMLCGFRLVWIITQLGLLVMI